MENKLKIALTFSGGGYRAATFHLGALSYLHTIKIGESTLLDNVVALSTISGGTIIACEEQLRKDWEEFQQNPLCKLDEWKK